MTVQPVYAAMHHCFPGEFIVLENDQFPCRIEKDLTTDFDVFLDMKKTKKRFVEIEQRNIIWDEKVITCDAFVHAGILYVPVRQVAEFLGKNVVYSPEEKTITLFDQTCAEGINSGLFRSEHLMPSIMKEIEVNNTPIFYHNKELDAHKKDPDTYFSFCTFSSEGRLFMPLKTLANATSLTRVYKDTDIYLYGDFPQIEAIDTGTILTGLDTKRKPDISDEVVKKFMIKAAGDYSEPGTAIDVAGQAVFYYGKPAVLVEIVWQPCYEHKQIITKLHTGFVYVLEQ